MENNPSKPVDIQTNMPENNWSDFSIFSKMLWTVSLICYFAIAKTSKSHNFPIVMHVFIGNDVMWWR